MTDPVFFTPARVFTVGEIAVLTGAHLVQAGMAGRAIEGIAPAAEGRIGQLVFVEGRKNAALAESVLASAVLCSDELAGRVPADVATLIVARPQAAFAEVGRLIFPAGAKPTSMTGETGISPAAHVHRSARLEDGVVVEPGAVIGADVAIGAGTIVAPNAVIGSGCQIGRNSFVGPGSSLQAALVGDRVVIHGGAVIGRAGFGFVPGPSGLQRMPQIGRVIIQNDVEIGANTTVDRGAMADTVIGEGSKIDNLVQIAHNVRIGRHCIVAGHCGLSGSVTLGDGVMLGGRVGLADHVTVGERAQVGAAAGVMHDIPAGERWVGYPAVPFRDFFRQVAAVQGLAKARKE